MTHDFRRLSSAWVDWMSRLRMTAVSVATDCADCQIGFVSNDGSFHLRQEDDWWIIDEIDDRGQRYNATTKLSTFALAEKYLIWYWSSATRTSLRFPALGPALLKKGFNPQVTVLPTDNEWLVELRTADGSVILPEWRAIIFSHLIVKPTEEIAAMMLNDLGLGLPEGD